MAIVTLEGTVENGQVRLSDQVTLPEHAKVYVVVPDFEIAACARVLSPRLGNPEQAAGFAKRIVDAPFN